MTGFRSRSTGREGVIDVELPVYLDKTVISRTFRIFFTFKFSLTQPQCVVFAETQTITTVR